MNSSLWLPLTFIPLGLSICAAWTQHSNANSSGYSRWLPLYLVALVCGLAGHFIQAPAVLSLVVLFALSKYYDKPELSLGLKTALFFGVVVVSLALALHLLPGFKNPLLVENIKFSAGAAPFTQYANFDKASVGLALLLFSCARVSNARELGQVLRKAAPVTLALVAFVLVLSMLSGLTRIDVKVPAFTAVFLATNLLFTCVAEEAFFRGLIQSRVSSALSSTRSGEVIAIVCSGLLFGAVHLAGGLAYALLASISGLGYAYLYSTTKRIEAPILAHFLVNALHFLLLTYPRVA